MRPRIVILLASSFLTSALFGTDTNATTRTNQTRANSSASAKLQRGNSTPRKKNSSTRASNSCIPCEQAASAKSRGAKKPKIARQPLPCHAKNYLDPKVARDFRGAERDLKRAGIAPKVTSAWRSSEYQSQLHKCSLNGRCRARRGVYGAMPSGQSLHEAGLAVDIAGVARNSRQGRYLTPQGRKIVKIMAKHGFNWRYGLADPAHFEADPRKAGYRSAAQAIKRTQQTCQVKLAAANKRRALRAKSDTSHRRTRLSARSAGSTTKARS
jgi:LAS superfamily LD-carboxypeptidase LdcB